MAFREEEDGKEEDDDVGEGGEIGAGGGGAWNVILFHALPRSQG